MPMVVAVPQKVSGSWVHVPEGQSASVSQNARHAGMGSEAREAQNDPATHMSAPGHGAPAASVPFATHAITAPPLPQAKVHFCPAGQPV
jgi:hypothetical protein